VSEPTWLTHNDVTLALHQLRHAGDGRPLLLLHGLGEASPASVPRWVGRWPGPVHALDFTGHGRSTVPTGGGYSAEILMADTDIALDRIGPATIVGRGLGAYVALLIAGARPALVTGAVLEDGPGLAGGGTLPGSAAILVAEGDGSPPDPWALAELSRDVRPPDYATSFARQALQFSAASWPFAVTARWRPPWLEAVATEPGVIDVGLDAAIAFYADLA
jgi:pimeloyl-ACP methyl ester carboxylesterase